MSNATIASMQAERPAWSLSEGARPILFAIIFPFTSLLIMSFPHKFDRWIAVSMVLIAAYAAFASSDQFSPDDTLNEVYSRYIIIGGSYMLCMAYKIDTKMKVQAHLEYRTAHPSWSPWYKGYKLMWNIRGVAMPWENPYLWPGQKHTWEARKSSTKSRLNLAARGRTAGVALRCGYVLLNFFLLICLYEFVNTQTLLDMVPSDYSPEKESIIRRSVQTMVGYESITPVTSRELQMRALFSFQNAADNFLLFSLYADVCAIFFISIGLDESWEWPPFFGQISKAYTMRRWWSMFWHRTVYRSFNSHSDLILSRLPIKEGSELYRALTAFNVFGLSAVMHSLVSWKYQNQCAWGRSMAYWLLQPVVFILEGIVQAFWKKARKALDVSGKAKAALDVFERAVGYAWVCAFLMWVDPKRHYPLGNCTLQYNEASY